MAKQINDSLLAELLVEQSSNSKSELGDSDMDADYQPPILPHSDDNCVDSDQESDEDSTVSESSEDEKTNSNQMDAEEETDVFLWAKNLSGFHPRKSIPNKIQPVILADVNRSTTALETFLKLFPMEIFEKIAFYTNTRFQIQKSKKSKNTPYLDDTSAEEMMIVLGCVLVMCCNRVPAMHMYWSTKNLLGNQATSDGISRNRFQAILAKLYFANPDKPHDATKTYYLDEVLACLKSNFAHARSDTTYQSLDESMTKFKGRSSLKQYMPLKPIKRGIKLWTRCDADSGYVYDTNIYCGKDTEQEGNLGERVVQKITEGVRNDVVLIFDRFFTFTHLLNFIEYAALGTYKRNRKNVAKLSEKFSTKGESEMAVCKEGLLCVHW